MYFIFIYENIIMYTVFSFYLINVNIYFIIFKIVSLCFLIFPCFINIYNSIYFFNIQNDIYDHVSYL